MFNPDRFVNQLDELFPDMNPAGSQDDYEFLLELHNDGSEFLSAVEAHLDGAELAEFQALTVQEKEELLRRARAHWTRPQPNPNFDGETEDEDE